MIAVYRALIFGAALLAAAPARAVDGGPLSLVMTYHAKLDQRVAFRRALEDDLRRHLQAAQQAGILNRYQILVSRYVDSETWDATALLSFADEAQATRWAAIERETPAGLSSKSLTLTGAIETAPADDARHGAAEGTPPTRPVFLVIPYEVLVPTGEYLKYLDGYTVPQLRGWIAEGVLARYDIYLARYAPGRPWAALLVLEYRDDHALGQRDAVVDKVRARLALDPAWKAISDDKKAVRTEKRVVIAEEVAAENPTPRTRPAP